MKSFQSSCYQKTKDTGLYLWVPRVFRILGFNNHANLNFANISIVPANVSNKYDPETIKGVFLIGKDMRFAEATGAVFINSVINICDLSFADLNVAILYNADLKDSKLCCANLNGANLELSDLRRADFRGARLRNANLKQAKLQDADFRGADLSTVVNLTKDQINTAIIDSTTKLPSNLKFVPRGKNTNQNSKM